MDTNGNNNENSNDTNNNNHNKQNDVNIDIEQKIYEIAKTNNKNSKNNNIKNSNELNLNKISKNGKEQNLRNQQRLNSIESATMDSKQDNPEQLQRLDLSNDASNTQTATITNTNLNIINAETEMGLVSGDWDLDTFFCHCTCALDTKQIETIMKDIQIKLISKNFKQVGFM